jgi:hypothetical protein
MHARAASAVALAMLAGCARPKPPGVQIDPALSILVPPDTTLIVGVRLDALRQTPLFQKYAAGAAFPALDELVRLTGVDPRKDAWELLFVSDGANSALLGRGNFAADMESKLERDGAKVIPHRMYHIVDAGPSSVVFLNSTTAAVGGVSSLRALLETRGRTKGPPPAIAERMKDIPAEVQLWAISLAATRGLPVPAGRGSLALPVESGLAYLDFRDGAKGVARAASSTEENAKELHDGLKGLIGFGRLSSPADQPDLLRAWDGFEVSREGKVVSVNIQESAELAEKLIRLATRGR